MNLASFFILLVLCSKFYFLWGFSVWPQPTAPLVVVALRDVICWGTLGTLMWQGRRQFKLDDLKYFAGIITVGILISGFHLTENKEFPHWLQHYMRNTLMPLLFYPAGLAYFRSQKTLQISKILMISTLLNVLLSVFEIAFFPHLMWGQTRPTGIIGDPLIMSLLILLGAFAFFSMSKWISFAVSSAVFYILIFASSVSAIVSFGAGLALTGMIALKARKIGSKKFFRIMGIASLCGMLFLSVAYIVSARYGNQKDMLTPKISSLIRSATCQGDKCKKHWSYQGRVLSNKIAFNLCATNLKECLLGQYSKSELQKVDSTLASLILNWGLIFTSMITIWILIHFKILIKRFESAPLSNLDLSLWAIIFFSCLTFSFFNAMIYKYPLNILFYLSMAAIKSWDLEKRT